MDKVENRKDYATAYAIDQQGGKGSANYAENVMPTLCSDSHGTPHAVAFSFDSLASNSMKSSNPHSGCREVSVARTLDTTDPNPSKNQGGIAIVEPDVFDGSSVTSPINASNPQPGDPCHTLSTDSRNYVVYESHPMDSRVKDCGDVSPTVTVKYAKGSADTPLVCESVGIIDSIEPMVDSVIDVEMEVAIRKYEVDKDRLVNILREHKGTLTNREIADKLSKPLTMVEHWFRTDKCFAVPDPDVWFQLKELLGIETDEFDQSITEFEFKGGNYDMRNGIHVGDVSPTLTCGSGNDLHLLPKKTYCLQGNGIDRADTAGCNGKGWKEGACYTLNTIDRPAVAYGLDRASFNQGQNAKFDFSVKEEQQPTLTARGPGAVCCTTESYMQTTEEVSPTLMARDWKDPTCVCTDYIVRRITPTECARLQGFPDNWGHPDKKESFTDEEYKFWLEVRNTHATINGKQVKDYTKEQMLTWYNKLHTDSSEYKMWGNGIALPTALYVMQGIAEALEEEQA